MNCETLQRSLDDYLDSALRRDDEAAVRRHLAECSSCRDSERALRSLLERSAALGASIEPPRDLWRDIDRRLDDVKSRPRREPRSATLRRNWGVGLLAASLMLAFFAGGILMRGVEQPPDDIAIEPGPAAATAIETTGVEPSDLLIAEQAIAEAEAQLRALLEQRRGALSDETVRTVEQTLALIETAVDDIRHALKETPGNRELGRKLLTARQRQLNLLQRATHLAVRGSRTDSI